MNRQWWHNKIAYQIYPKSFCDSNGDGIGDIRGIITKLDYLKSLGVDIIWISPCYPSPLADQGYDISDYYDIDPRFGTLEDMDELIAEARRRDMYILMDLVVNHCSDEHEWFRKACEDPSGRYGKYFYIEDADPSGKLPCNWRSCFGGPVWSELPGHPDKLYLHIFHKKQPDLNWENPEVREEIYKIIQWWMDRGIAGFRIDAIINVKKLIPYRDYPADRDDGLCETGRMLEDVTGLGEFLGEMRDRVFIPNKALTIGEVFNEKYDELADFIGDNGYFSSMFDFSHVVCGKSRKGLYDSRQITTEEYKQCVNEAQKRIGDTGFYSLVIENHDRPRAASYYLPESGRTEAGKKCLALAYFMQRGLPFIYQGQEIGMENTEFASADDFDDIGTIDEIKVSLDAGLSSEEALLVASLYSRDNARTPMQWTGGAHAGFTGGEPWLRENPLYREINVEEQQKRGDSVLSYYKKLIALRKDPAWKEVLIYGDFVPYLEDEKDLIAYLRTEASQEGGKAVLVAANFSADARTIRLPKDREGRQYKSGRTLLSGFGTPAAENGCLRLEGLQAAVISLDR